MEEMERPNVRNNPFLNHDGRQVNVIDCNGYMGGKLEDIKLPMKCILEGLKATRYEMLAERKEGRRILKGDEEGLFYECPGVEGKHHIEDCPELKLFVKRMIKLGVFALPKSVKEQSVNMIHPTPPIFKVSPQRSALVFKVPKQFPYQSDHAVLWRYETVVESNTRANHSLQRLSQQFLFESHHLFSKCQGNPLTTLI